MAKLSLDLLMAVGSEMDLKSILEKKQGPTRAEIIEESKKRLSKALKLGKGKENSQTPLVLAPIVMPKERPELFHRVGQVQDILDCICTRCGNKWHEVGTLWDSFRKIDPDTEAFVFTLTPAGIRFNAMPTKRIVPQKRLTCLSCYRLGNPGDQEVPTPLSDLLG